MNRSTLLLLDAVVNLGLGFLLILIPDHLFHLFGVPIPESKFYANILGAVLVGIGIALLIEIFGSPRGFSGLGLEGAVVINILGAACLIKWLILDNLVISIRGTYFLWFIGILVLGISLLEILIQMRLQLKE